MVSTQTAEKTAYVLLDTVGSGRVGSVRYVVTDCTAVPVYRYGLRLSL